MRNSSEIPKAENSAQTEPTATPTPEISTHARTDTKEVPRNHTRNGNNADTRRNRRKRS